VSSPSRSGPLCPTNRSYPVPALSDFITSMSDYLVPSLERNTYSAAVNPPPPPTWANVKWSKLLINGLPTGTSDTQGPYTPEECHQSLAANNPAYATLPVMQKPSWVRAPLSYTAGSSSSLVVAFKDPDGSRLKSLLVARHLFAFSTRATIRKWKQRTTKQKPTSNDNGIELEDVEEDVEIQTRAITPTQAPLVAVSPLMPLQQLYSATLSDSPPRSPLPPKPHKVRQTRARA
jgi:hypothetical protein